MPSMISQLLIQPVPKPLRRGRVIRFGGEEPDIQFATGPLEQRIQSYMRALNFPATAKEIAVGIGSNASRVTKGLKLLIKANKVIVVEIDGCVREYSLR